MWAAAATRPLLNYTGIAQTAAACFVVERLHCFGMSLENVRVLALEFSGILPSIHGVLGLRELRASQATLDLVRNTVTTP